MQSSALRALSASSRDSMGHLKILTRRGRGATHVLMSATRNQITLDELAETLAENGGDMHLAAKRAGCTVSFINHWRRDDPKADAVIAAAIDAGTSVLESAMIRRAVKGVKEPIISKGEVVGYKRKYSDGLLEFALKAKKPDVYGTKVQIDQKITVTTLSDTELNTRIHELSERLGLTYQPLPEAEFTEVVEYDLDDLL